LVVLRTRFKVTEPQSVSELMAQCRALWGRQLDLCEDDTREARRDLYNQITALGDEYPEADYPRREDLEKTLRGLISLHTALPDLIVPNPEPELAPTPEAVATPAEPSLATSDEAEANPSPDFSAETTGDIGPTPSRGGATGGLGRRLFGWYRWVYNAIDYQVLCGSREQRLSELGGRVDDLRKAGRLADVAEDMGVAQMIAQVDAVDAAIEANRTCKAAACEA